jgi:hypothetical protein
MNTKTLGRLHKVDLREAWASECSDFTPWLAQEENLKLLGEVIAIELELESQEKDVGPFRADILCKDTATDNWVLIENQLERTDHCHLGQLVTYAAGLNAVTIVWIAERFTDEHRAALDWLNEHTDDKIQLFGLEIELWRIGDSPVAPKFNIVSKPNDWTHTVQQAAVGVEVTPHRQLQQRFWTGFKEFMEAKKSFIRCQKPGTQGWMNHPIGRSGIHLTSAVSTWNMETNSREPQIRAELYMDGPNAKQDFSFLEKHKEEIENALGLSLVWYDTKLKHCRIYARENADFLNENLWLEQFEWLRQNLEKMHKVFAPLVKNIPLENVVESV